MKDQLRTVFMGTPEIAVPSLKKVIEISNCVAVYTGADKIRGRGRKVIPTPIKKVAEEYNISIEQPETFKDENVREKLKSYNPDLLIVMAYGFLLPKKVLRIPELAPVNLHGSILPNYRGASPIHQSLLNGDDKTGVTAQYMVKKMDAGDILHIEEVNITEDDNYESLSDKIAEASAVCIEKVIHKYESNTIERTPQNEQKATYCKKIEAEDGLINWNDSAVKIIGEIKAFYKWPHSYTFYDDKKIIIKKAKIHSRENKGNAGEVIQANKNGLLVQTGKGILDIKELQLEKKKPLDYKSFLNGFKLKEGKSFVNNQIL